MRQLSASFQFFQFLKENSYLFPICTLFAGFYYYLVSLLSGPQKELDQYYASTVNSTISQSGPQITELSNLVFSLQFAAIISFLLFAIILVSIIATAMRDGILAQFFGVLLIMLLFFSFSYLKASFKDSILGILVIGLPVLIFFGYTALMNFLLNKYRKNEYFDFGLWWYLILDFLMMITLGIWYFFKFIPTLEKTIELAYFIIFLLFFVLMMITGLAFHLLFLAIHLEDITNNQNETRPYFYKEE